MSIDDFDDANDTFLTLGGGLRAYLGSASDRVRSFAGGGLGIVDRADTDITMGGFFGVEAMIIDGFSISGHAGADLTMLGCNGCGTNVNLGTSAVQFNFYF
ncbi:hypothetical protein [Desulfurispira natronophila]|uniref:Uncharacterized protein n=1 Tax=Desulfurispira natronophila TaxID=682562 RepID=A0A7W7Y4S6_9BACT|nr:hypothetical protein [Desulfurispira natronophila]MBB5022086.1 hypothetical protein [Desulfurispira natronophila]